MSVILLLPAPKRAGESEMPKWLEKIKSDWARKPISFLFVPLGFCAWVCSRLLQSCLSPVASIKLETHEYVWTPWIIVIVSGESWDESITCKNLNRISTPNNEFHSMDWRQLMFGVGIRRRRYTLQFALIGNFHGNSHSVNRPHTEFAAYE